MTAEYTLLSSDHGTCAKAEYILGYKTNLNKCKGTKVTEYIPYYGIKLKINKTVSNRKFYKHLETKQHTSLQFMSKI